MRRLDLFPQQVLNVAIQEEWPASWAETYRGKRKAHHGSECTMCPKRYVNQVDDDGFPAPILKPLVLKPTVAGDSRRMLVVSDTTSFSSSITRAVKYIRAAGFTGQIIVDLAVKCGGGRIDKVEQPAIKNCRPHLAFTYNLVKPTHILLCGTRATKAFLGETVMVHKNRMCWQMIETEWGRIPCVCTVSPADATGNYIYRRVFRQEAHFLVNHDWSQAPELSGTVRVVETGEHARALLKWAREGSYLAFDFETTGKLFKDIKAICLGFARHDSSITWAIHPQAMDDPEVAAIVREILTDPDIGKVGQNVKYDMHVAEQYYGVVPAPIIGCTRLMFKTLNAEADADLEAIGMLVGIGSHKTEAKEDLKRASAEIKERFFKKHGRKPKNKRELDPMSEAYGLLDLDILLRYCALDCYTTAVAYVFLKEQLRTHEFLGRTYKKRVAKANTAFRRVERNGLLVSQENIKLAADFAEKEIKAARKRIQEYKFPDTAPRHLRGWPIDPDKTQSIRDFFDAEELKIAYYTDKGNLASTNKKALKMMRNQHTVISHIIEYRESSKLASSYITTLPYFIRGDGRVHPNILLDGARSGRMSMTDPGMQTIPSGDGLLAKMVKNCFVAPRGRTLISLDYKTLEIYIAALWSMDEAMISTLATPGLDFHTETAKRISRYAWAMEPEEIEAVIKADLAKPGGESPHRKMAKKATFSTIYGMGADTLADDISAPRQMAKDIITGLFSEYSGLKRALDGAVRYARQYGEIIIPWNHKPSRRRPLPFVGYNDWRRGNAERAAGNGCIQGWAADFCTESTIKLDEIFENDYNGSAQVDLTVHDSILIECDDALVDEVVGVAMDVMTSFPSAPLKLKVDVKVGKAWGGMVDWVHPSKRKRDQVVYA